jgi:hypothetical protein
MWRTVREYVGISKPAPAALPKRTIPPCSDLYDLVLDLDWDRVIQHCSDHPQDARFQEGDGLETPLYLACQWRPPLPVIQALIQANPEALQWTSREFRDLPLHMICRYDTTSTALLQEFTTRYPAGAVHATKYGKTPLQVLWEFARPDCLKQNRRPETEEEQLAVQQFWDKVQLLVHAVATSRQHAWPQKENRLYKVHAVVSLRALGCPREILEYVCAQYPHELSQRDETGQLPLHVAVGPTQWSGKRKYKPREQAIIQLLLQLYPEAARVRLFSLWDYYENGKRQSSAATRINRQGRYPLQIALANRHTWEGGVQELFWAAPEVLSLRDPVTQLYPFQLAAIPVQENLAVDVSTIVDLLRQRPDLIEEASSSERPQRHEENNEPEEVLVVDATTVAVSESKPTKASQEFGLHLSRQEDESTLLFGLVVVVAVGAGLWCWAKHHHPPTMTAVSSQEETYTTAQA